MKLGTALIQAKPAPAPCLPIVVVVESCPGVLRIKEQLEQMACELEKGEAG
jgi:hypothetical protein